MINFEDRLSKLKDRRQGTAERYLVEKQLKTWGDARPAEDHERINESVAIKYVIGSMAPVSQESTDISIAEGKRVASNLISRLQTAGISTEMRLQGSVALNIHIEGHSDVDMLVLKTDFITVDSPVVDPSKYQFNTSGKSMVDALKELRDESEEKLSNAFYKATVDVSKGKCISLSDGSLQRKVDIVPASWHDTVEYQRDRQEHFRAVNVYDKKEHKLHENKPFLHIRRINDRDAWYSGNLKKVIRLMKNIIADMPEYKKTKVKKLSSYDIAGIAYAMDKKLACSILFPLTLLDNLRNFLMFLVAINEGRDLVYVPDGTRRVFDSPEKDEALFVLYSEVSALSEAVQKAINPHKFDYDGSVLTTRQVVV